eukprot:scaffold169150_cov19-Tisochrysis_lutea.AAC.1
MQPHYATQFQQLLLAGDWEGTLNLLPTLTADEEVSKDVKCRLQKQKVSHQNDRLPAQPGRVGGWQNKAGRL